MAEVEESLGAAVPLGFDRTDLVVRWDTPEFTAKDAQVGLEILSEAQNVPGRQRIIGSKGEKVRSIRTRPVREASTMPPGDVVHGRTLT